MQQSYHKFTSLTKIDEGLFHKNTLVFNVEDTLLKSSSLFPYFMLVAFEGGGPLRALILLFMYPFLCILGEKMRLKIMIFISFFGVKKQNFRIGRSVLPKFFLENVGCESLEVVMRFSKKMGVTNLPKIMVEDFLMNYVGVEDIYGPEIRVFGGYYIGLLDNSGKEIIFAHMMSQQSQYVGICSINNSFKTCPFTYIKVFHPSNKHLYMYKHV